MKCRRFLKNISQNIKMISRILRANPLKFANRFVALIHLPPQEKETIPASIPFYVFLTDLFYLFAL